MTTSPARFPDRSLSLAALAACVVLAATTSARAGPREPAPVDVVRAKRFELVDDDGRVRAALFVEGGPRLMMYDLAGKHRVALALHGEEAPGLELFTAEGSHALQVRHMNGAPLVSLHDTGGNDRLRLTLSGGPEPKASVTALGERDTVEATWPSRPTQPLK
jgi:hypothetical protein